MDLFKFFSKEQSTSKDIAKERLKMVLVNDRSNVSPKFLEMLKGDIVDVISNYMEVEEKDMNVKFTRTIREDDTPVQTLVANIPIKKVKNIGKNTY
ncbi:MAG: cell division topological specificity factor MinE [Clostridia bacterium]|nr:cell division topological specificity factor MinE [Clostridia bacterium]